MNEMLQGIAICGGISIGEVFILRIADEKFSEEGISCDNLSEEMLCLDGYVEQVKKELAALARGLEGEHKSIIDGQRLLLDELSYEIREVMKKDLVPPVKAIDKAKKGIKQRMLSSEEVFQNEIYEDIEDISLRLKYILMGKPIIDEIKLPSVIVASKLFASQITEWDRENVLGLVMEEGTQDSHVAIVARALGIPAVFGAKGLMSLVAKEDRIIIDGYRGEVHINPGDILQKEYRKHQDAEIRSIENVLDGGNQPAFTKDNIEVFLLANAFNPDQGMKALNYGAAGIGLLRTELIFETLNHWPSEEEQLQIYKNIIKKAVGLPVTIRTLDIGGEKHLPYTRMPREENPILGRRGVRFTLDREEIFKTQLRAILRAGLFGQVKLLIPMITDVEEIRLVKNMINEVKDDLRKRVMDFDDEMEIGAMVEVPSAALTVDILADEVDFLSVGTNDLTQYLLAVDRNNENVNLLYDHLHPAMVRLMDQIISDAQAAGIKLSICGDMAGDRDGLLMLLGLGAREFSVEANLIPGMKNVLKNVEISALQQEVASFIEQSSAHEIRHSLEKFREDNMSNA